MDGCNKWALSILQHPYRDSSRAGLTEFDTRTGSGTRPGSPSPTRAGGRASRTATVARTATSTGAGTRLSGDGETSTANTPPLLFARKREVVEHR